MFLPAQASKSDEKANVFEGQGGQKAAKMNENANDFSKTSKKTTQKPNVFEGVGSSQEGRAARG